MVLPRRPTSKACLHRIALNYTRLCILCTYTYMYLYILVRFNIFHSMLEQILFLFTNSCIETGIEKFNFNAPRPGCMHGCMDVCLYVNVCMYEYSRPTDGSVLRTFTPDRGLAFRGLYLMLTLKRHATPG